MQMLQVLFLDVKTTLRLNVHWYLVEVNEEKAEEGREATAGRKMWTVLLWEWPELHDFPASRNSLYRDADCSQSLNRLNVSQGKPQILIN